MSYRTLSQVEEIERGRIKATIFLITAPQYIVFLSHNQAYRSITETEYVRDVFAADTPSARSEGGTPAPPPETPQDVLRFTTEHTPKDPAAGFIFGTDVDQCDVLLHPSRNCPISGRHFAVNFGLESGALILKSISRQKTRVKLEDENVNLSTQLSLRGTASVTASLPGLDVDIWKPWAGTDFPSGYVEFLARLEAHAPGLGTLKLQSSAKTSKSAYQLDHPVGHGASGLVYRALHRQTGDVVAIKRFGTKDKFAKTPWEESALLCSLRHVRNN